MKKIFILLILTIALNADIVQDIENFNIYLEKAKLGDNEAKYITAINYFQAKGTQKDTNEAMYWLKNSLQGGYAKAIWLTAKIYLHTSNKKAQQKGKKLLLLLGDYENYFPKEYAKNPYKINRYKAIALMRLAELSQTDKIKDINKFYVINKYFPEKARYEVDMTPLLMAIQNDNISLAKELVKRGADINLANSRGETPVLSAMRNRHVRFAKELMRLGADTSVIDNEKNSVFSYALAMHQQDIALDVLKNKKFNIYEWVDGGVFQGRNDVYAEYISSKKSKGRMFTYLHVAAKNDAQKVMQKLIEMGLDVNTTMRSDRISLDALGIATRYASLSSVKLLIKLGANPYVIYINTKPEGNYGLSYWGALSAKYTPLSMAVCREHQDETIVKYLLSLKSAKWYVKHESQYFYFYLLQMKKSQVLKFFDQNSFKDREKIRERFEIVSKKKRR